MAMTTTTADTLLVVGMWHFSIGSLMFGALIFYISIVGGFYPYRPPRWYTRTIEVGVVVGLVCYAGGFGIIGLEGWGMVVPYFSVVAVGWSMVTVSVGGVVGIRVLQVERLTPWRDILQTESGIALGLGLLEGIRVLVNT